MNAPLHRIATIVLVCCYLVLAPFAQAAVAANNILFTQRNSGNTDNTPVYVAGTADRLLVTSAAGVPSLGTVSGNLTFSSGTLSTIQGIRTTDTPQFARIGVGTAADGTIKVLTDGIIKTSDTTAATNTTTGAFQVVGGAGIGGDVYAGGLINLSSAGTTAANGLQWGTDSQFYRIQAGGVRLNAAGNNPTLKLASAGTDRGQLEIYTPDSALYITSGTGYSTVIRTNGGTVALTLSTAQLATFAGNLTVSGTGTHTFAGKIVSTAPTGGIGYATGAGGTQTQGTSKATTVVLNTVTGEITMHNATLNAATIVSFTFTNSAIAAGDFLLVQHVSAGTVGAYTCTAVAGAGTSTIYVRNNTAGNLGEAIVLKFVVIRAANS
jgi:hypothetical protein